MCSELVQARKASTTIRARGRNVTVPSTVILGREIVCSRGWLRTARVRDEDFVLGEIVPDDPAPFIGELCKWEARPDLFVFSRRPGNTEPLLPYRVEWHDFAAIPITTYEDWEKRVKKDVRRNVRRARRDGVEVRRICYDEDFVRGIKSIYDESPVRQGKRFWHYGKTLDELREVHATYSERAEYIGAYYQGELIGFIKMVYTDDCAKTMHVISKQEYHRMHPTNALIAEAVRICVEKELRYFIYGEFTFPGVGENSLTEFKRRNGFEKLEYPTFIVPLTLKGKVAVALGMHQELRNLLPRSIRRKLVGLRSRLDQLRLRRKVA